MKRKAQNVPAVVIVIVLIVVAAILIRNYIQKPAGSVFDCTSMQNTTCQFEQCPPGYAPLSYLQCSNPKGNTCCQELRGGQDAYVEQES